ncbi:hypothetical protein BO71DRAFT_480896 [Aspergillus ellipticus CBS 707.79]|uniref:Copper transport protein n=1 Tax=Aspergillus ellipticus CBS 707.79 TaxID=1448320 RepID=A0A319E2B7_9EURO|nr:hypothetical protein BO71DRAFT_480896 [Aspergillus ellipticus CBS 707.79]
MDMNMSTTMTSMESTTSDPSSMSMTMAIASTTSTGMSMSTTTSSSSMDMDMSTSSSMTMTFFTSASTPLYSISWTPANKGQYAGTCIFLIVLAVILRLLLALKPILETHLWADSSLHNNHMHTQTVTPAQDIKRRWSRWRINPAAGRATLELGIVGVGYLLMLAVMTMNVGYFLSVLAGIWLGTFVLGGLAADNWWAHC